MDRPTAGWMNVVVAIAVAVSGCVNCDASSPAEAQRAAGAVGCFESAPLDHAP